MQLYKGEKKEKKKNKNKTNKKSKKEKKKEKKKRRKKEKKFIYIYIFQSCFNKRTQTCIQTGRIIETELYRGAQRTHPHLYFDVGDLKQRKCPRLSNRGDG